jgi:hypothetical protein
LHCVALGFIVSGLLLSGRPLVRIQPGVPEKRTWHMPSPFFVKFTYGA